MPSSPTVLREAAARLGFDRLSVTGPERAPRDEERLWEWVQSGRAASMDWLAREPRRRADPRAFLAEARSVISLAVSYHGGEFPPAPGMAYGRVARYAWGRDYHGVIESRLGQFKDFLRREFGDVLARPSVDVQPLLERAFARRAGLGFVGKNTNLIVSGAGSFLFLAHLVVNLDLPSDGEIPAGCGDCVRCLTHCPTGALDAPYVLDSRKCVAYHTIENRGSIPPELRAGVGDWVFGCDACQDVCPHNVRAWETRWPEFSPERGVGAWVSLRDILSLRTGEQFKARFGATPLMRAKRAGLLRNACVVARNRGAVDELKAILVEARDSDADPLVRESARWALNESSREI